MAMATLEQNTEYRKHKEYLVGVVNASMDLAFKIGYGLQVAEKDIAHEEYIRRAVRAQTLGEIEDLINRLAESLLPLVDQQQPDSVESKDGIHKALLAFEKSVKLRTQHAFCEVLRTWFDNNYQDYGGNSHVPIDVGNAIEEFRTVVEERVIEKIRSVIDERE